MSHHEEHEHTTPYKTYVFVWIVLMILTILTVEISRYHFGDLNIVIAMAIASVKAGVVALWFMHLKHEDSITWVFALYPLFLLGLLIGLTSVDVFNRVVP